MEITMLFVFWTKSIINLSTISRCTLNVTYFNRMHKCDRKVVAKKQIKNVWQLTKKSIKFRDEYVVLNLLAFFFFTFREYENARTYMYVYNRLLFFIILTALWKIIREMMIKTPAPYMIMRYIEHYVRKESIFQDVS